MPELFFEDFRPGQVFELGSRTLTEAEIVAFAREWDPQSFHVDPVAAVESNFGGLIASGWQSAAVWMRLYVDAVLVRAASMGSPGVEELRWVAPVRPGDTLTGTFTVLEATPSERNPRRGSVRSRAELVNQDGVTVLTMLAFGHFARRET